MAKASTYIGKDVLGNDIFWAETDEVSRFPEQLEKLLLAIGEYMGWDGDLSHVFVSDLSSLADFCLDDSEIKELSEKFGVSFKGNELLSLASAMLATKQ